MTGRANRPRRPKGINYEQLREVAEHAVQYSQAARPTVLVQTNRRTAPGQRRTHLAAHLRGPLGDIIGRGSNNTLAEFDAREVLDWLERTS